MSLQTDLRIRRRSSGKELNEIEDVFLRRDYDLQQQYPSLSLSAGVKTEIETPISDVAFLYIRRTGDSAGIQVFKNLSPESYTFDDCFLIIGLDDDVSSVYLEADTDTTVYIFIAGS